METKSFDPAGGRGGDPEVQRAVPFLREAASVGRPLPVPEEKGNHMAQLTRLESTRRLVKSLGLKNLWQNPNSDAKFVYSRDGKKKGLLTGKERFCGLEGCVGIRLGVRWPGGRITWPCTQGMDIRPDKQWIIE
jgi:hypothetical protein